MEFSLLLSALPLWTFMKKVKADFLFEDLCMQIGGIGKVTEQMLRQVLGISTCQEMLQKASFLCALFSESSAGSYVSNTC